MGTSVKVHDPATLIEFYVTFLKERHLSPLTIRAYQRNIQALSKRLSQKGILLIQATSEDIDFDLRNLYDNLLAKGNSVNQYLQSARGFYRYLVSRKFLAKDPTRYIQSLRKHRSLSSMGLTQAEFEAIVNAPDLFTTLGCRDRAMFQVLCETGMSVSNLVGLTLE